MIEVDLLQIEQQEEALREEEKKLQRLDENFQDVMHSLGHFIKMDSFLAVQSRIGHQMDENQDGMRKMADGLGRARQIYRNGERRIVDQTEANPRETFLYNWPRPSYGYLPFSPNWNIIPNPFPSIWESPPIDLEDIFSGTNDSE